jgi:hypothetical protein
LTTADAPTFTGLTIGSTGNLKGATISVADDAATSFTPTSGYGFLFVHVVFAATYFGIIHYRATAVSNFCEIASGGAGVEVTTGALSGTTGTDGKLTISTHTDQKIYIENRTGDTRNVYVLSVCGN